MELNKDNMKKIMLLIVFTILVFVGVNNLSTVWRCISLVFHMLFPFIMGCAIAFIINLPMRSIEKHIFQREKWKDKKWVRKIARPASLILALLLIIAIILLVFFVVVPQLSDTVIELGYDISHFWPKVQRWAIALFDDNPEIANWITTLEIDWESIMQQAIGFLKTGAGTLLGSTFSVAKVIVNSVTNFAIAFVFAMYILLQKEKLQVQSRKVMYAFLPEKVVETILDVCSLANRTFSNFFTGQCLEAVILGCMFVVVMSILRFPYALLVGILIAFTALIPIFGAFIGCAVGTFLILMENPMQALAFIIVFLLLQQIEGNLIYPHVVGNSVGLPSIWVLVAVSLGGSLMGVVGMLVFIPLVSVIYTLFRKYVYRRLKERKVLSKCEKDKENII